MPPLNLLGAGFGALESIYNNVSGEKDRYKRFKEKGVAEAEAQTMADRERILAQSPVTNAKLKQKAIQDAGAAGLAVAGNAGGSAANSGMAGGDVSSGAIQGAKASQFTGQVAAQTGAQLADTYTGMAQEQANQANQLQQNTMQKAQIADMVTYDKLGDKQGTFAGVLGGMVGGANALSQIAKLDLPGSIDVEKEGEEDPLAMTPPQNPPPQNFAPAQPALPSPDLLMQNSEYQPLSGISAKKFGKGLQRMMLPGEYNSSIYAGGR